MCLPLASLAAQRVKNLPANAGDAGSVPGSGRSPGEGNGNPLQYSSPVHPMDRGAFWATVHGVARIRHDLVSKPAAPCVSVVQNPRATYDRAELIRAAEGSQRTDGQKVRGTDGREFGGEYLTATPFFQETECTPGDRDSLHWPAHLQLGTLLVETPRVAPPCWGIIVAWQLDFL